MGCGDGKPSLNTPVNLYNDELPLALANVTHALLENLCDIVPNLRDGSCEHVFYFSSECLSDARQQGHHRPGSPLPPSDGFTSKEFQTDKNLGCFHKLTELEISHHLPPPISLTHCTLYFLSHQEIFHYIWLKSL